MTKESIADLLGPDFVIEKIIEDKDELYAFYVSTKFVDSGENDKYTLVGAGPFYYNKITKEKKKLGAKEFHDNHLPKKIFEKHLINYEKKPLDDLDEIIIKIRRRSHCNGDEFDLIFNHLGIELSKISVSSSDSIYFKIEYYDKEKISELKAVFEKAELEIHDVKENSFLLRNDYE